MIKIRTILIVGFLGVSSCTSLKDTVIDDKMRFQGSFSCNAVSEENPHKKETLAEADVSRVRCAKDAWEIHGDQIRFTRTLYQTRVCDSVLGRIQFSTDLKSARQKLTLGVPHCKLVRATPGWMGEESGKCMLKDLKLETPYDLHSVFHCRNYVPEFCNENASLEVTPDSDVKASGHDPFSKITISKETGSSLMSCERYATE